VLLVNQCATVLKLDQLQLIVQPMPVQDKQQQQQQQQQQPAAAEGQQQQQQQRSVSVSLAAGSKPVRVLLGYTPKQAGYMAVTGVKVTGMTVISGRNAGKQYVATCHIQLCYK
jgi:hypothetical protein